MSGTVLQHGVFILGSVNFRKTFQRISKFHGSLVLKLSVVSDEMGGHISQKWYECTTSDQEINHYGQVYQLVIENVARCD